MGSGGGTSGGPPHLRLEMLSNPIYNAGARELVASVARRLGFSEHQSGQMALAVDEALCNIFRHGYERRGDGKIWLSLWPTEDEGGGGLRIVLEDEARQVDPAVIKSRDLAEIRPGGLGVHIIQQVMDQAVYERREGAGMRLTMMKRKGAPGSGGPAIVQTGCCGQSACGA